MAESRRIETVGVVLHPGKTVNEEVSVILRWLARRCQLHLEERLRDAEGLPEEISFGQPVDYLPSADLVLTFGGDGTLIGAARQLENSETLVLGLHLGHLGFMTEGTLSEGIEILETIFEGHHWVDERLRLTGTLFRNGREIFRADAMNDVVIKQGELTRPLLIDTYIDQVQITQIRADGLIVSTPTGSTAYSYSAGGPIIHPYVACFELTPICPHTVTSRSIVVPTKGVIRMILLSTDHNAFLSFDGQENVCLQEKDRVEVTVSPVRVSFARVKRHVYYKTLREKLYWQRD